MWSLPSLVAVIGLLVLINGLFASMEIALVSVPRARLKRFEKEKRPGASTAISLQRNIDDFFATVQIGVTFVATLSSAIGGAAAVGVFSPIIEAMGISPSSVLGHAVAILFVTVAISYVSLIMGELVPKSMARRHPGKVSLTLAPFFSAFSTWMRPAVKLLTASTRVVLKVLGVSPSQKATVLTPEEFRIMAMELVETRQIPVSVFEMLVRVTRLAKIRVEDVMIPRHRISYIRINTSVEADLEHEALKMIGDQPFTNFPVLDGKGENVLGILNLKDFLRNRDRPCTSDLLRPAVFTARGQSLDRVLTMMQKKRAHLSVVVDEHGIIDGIITLRDILEELVGEIDSDIDAPPTFRSHLDPWLGLEIDGQTTLHELEEFYALSLPRSLHYSTVAGFVMDRLGKMPAAGDRVDYDEWRFEVLDMEGTRVKGIRISPLRNRGND